MRSHVAANRRHGCSGRTCTQPRGAAQPAVLEAGIQEQACDAGRARAARLPQLGPHVALRGGLHGQRRAQPCGSYVVPQLPQLCLSQRHTLQQAGPHAGPQRSAPAAGTSWRTCRRWSARQSSSEKNFANCCRSAAESEPNRRYRSPACAGQASRPRPARCRGQRRAGRACSGQEVPGVAPQQRELNPQDAEQLRRHHPQQVRPCLQASPRVTSRSELRSA